MARIRRNVEFWKQRVQQWEGSGLGAGEFAAQEGLRVERLRFWKRRLDADGARGTSASKASSAKPSFLPVVIAASRSDLKPLLEVVVRTGHTVRVPVDFDDAALLRLLAVLGAA